MLKQKIAQFKEYVRLRRHFKELETQCSVAFKESIVAEAEISILKKRHFSTAWRRPHDDLFGTINYPCIIGHEWEHVFDSFGQLTYSADIKTHNCNKYQEHSICSDTTCFWYARNRAAAEAWRKWQDVENQYAAAKKQYDAAREQLFGCVNKLLKGHKK